MSLQTTHGFLTLQNAASPLTILAPRRTTHRTREQSTFNIVSTKFMLLTQYSYDFSRGMLNSRPVIVVPKLLRFCLCPNFNRGACLSLQ